MAEVALNVEAGLQLCEKQKHRLLWPSTVLYDRQPGSNVISFVFAHTLDVMLASEIERK